MEQPFFDSKKIIPTLSSLLIVKKYFQSIFAFSPSCPSNVATGPQVVFHFLYSGVWIMGSIVSFHICLLLIILFPICLFLWHAVFERVTKNAVCGLWAWRSKLNLVGGHINVFTGEWTQKVQSIYIYVCVCVCVCVMTFFLFLLWHYFFFQR